MFKSKKSQKALSSLVALTFALTIPVYGITSVYTGLNKTFAAEDGSNSSDNWISGTEKEVELYDPIAGYTPSGKEYTITPTASSTTGLTNAQMAKMSQNEVQKAVDQHDAEEMAKKGADNLFVAAGIDLVGGGIPISSNVRYAYVSTDGYSGRAVAVCMP